MNGIRFASLVAVLAASGCSVGTSSAPAYPSPQPMAWSGPPGGAIDPGYGYGEPGGADGSYESSYPPEGDYGEPSADPNDPNYALGDVTDVEIEATLQAYGEWVEDPVYGYVWLPYATVVGEDFTPYDSSGEWVYTDYGWSFASDFDWGWLAFHFGRWMLYEDRSWGWVPERQWGANWCEWRSGSNTVGWRPMPPRVRDNTTNGALGWRPSNVGPANRRPNRNPDAGWSFAAQTEFGLRNRPTAFALSEGIRATTPVVRPPAGTPSGRAAALMGGRLRTSAWQSTHPRTVRPNVDTRPGFTGARPQRWGTGGAGELGQSTAGGRPWMNPPARGNAWQQPSRPTWNRPPDRAPQRPTWSDGSRGNGGAVRSWQPNNGNAWQPPSRPNGTAYQPRPSDGNAWQPPSRPNGGNAWQQPRPNSGNAWQQPRPSWNPPSDRGPRYNPPSRGNAYQPPSGGNAYQPPSRGNAYQPPSRGNAYQPPSRPSGNAWQPPSRPSYSPPRDRAPSSGSFSSGSSRPSYSPPRDRAPSSGSFSSGSSRSHSAPSSSGGSRSYSAPSSSGSSKSYSSPSSSGSSRSSGSSSSSGSSRSSGGGGRR